MPERDTAGSTPASGFFKIMSYSRVRKKKKSRIVLKVFLSFFIVAVIAGGIVGYFGSYGEYVQEFLKIEKSSSVPDISSIMTYKMPKGYSKWDSTLHQNRINEVVGVELAKKKARIYIDLIEFDGEKIEETYMKTLKNSDAIMIDGEVGHFSVDRYKKGKKEYQNLRVTVEHNGAVFVIRLDTPRTDKTDIMFHKFLYSIKWKDKDNGK